MNLIINSIIPPTQSNFSIEKNPSNQNQLLILLIHLNICYISNIPYNSHKFTEHSQKTFKFKSLYEENQEYHGISQKYHTSLHFQPIKLSLPPPGYHYRSQSWLGISIHSSFIAIHRLIHQHIQSARNSNKLQ